MTVAMKFKVFLKWIFNFPSVNLQQFPMSCSSLMLGKYKCSCSIQLDITVKQHNCQFSVCEQTSSVGSVLQQQEIKTQHLTNL